MYIVNIKGLIILSLKLYIQNLSAIFSLEFNFSSVTRELYAISVFSDRNTEQRQYS